VTVGPKVRQRLHHTWLQVLFFKILLQLDLTQLIKKKRKEKPLEDECG
jgi:hypothetical protein